MDIALQWMTSNCSSNTELAVLSNVCRAWRRIVCKELVKCIHDKSPVSSLLLPCMMQELLLRRRDKNLEGQKIQCDSLSSNFDNSNHSSSFCLAWFAPKGIQIDSVSVDDDISSDSEEEHVYPSNLFNHTNHHGSKYSRKTMLYESGTKNYSSHALSPLKSSNPGTSRRMAMDMGEGNSERFTSERQTVARAWKGYKDAMDVLLPFGYTNDFVTKAISYTSARNILPNSTTTKDFKLSNDKINSDDKSGDHSVKINTGTTFAVRGAIEARPEGIPWDDSRILDDNTVRHLNHYYNKKNESTLDNLSKNIMEVDKKVSRKVGTNDEHEKLVRHKYQLDFDISQQKQRIQEIRKKIKAMKYSLPRIVLSSNEKNQRYYYEHVQSKFIKNEDITSKSPHRLSRSASKKEVGERRQRSVQFVNINDTRAIRMRTLPFECGPVTGPITIFCVGIATEDGSFLSGLRRRLELGHMYPQNARDEMIDMSPICIGVGITSEEETIEKIVGNVGYNGHSLKQRKDSFDDIFDILNQHNKNDCSESRNNDNDSNSSCWDNGSDVEEEDSGEEFIDVYPPHITRGITGPGRWHCYTAIFDEEESLLRVDGLTEGGAAESLHNTKKEDEGSQVKKFKPILDGLTIGSDHCFDMSLCFAGGDTGEGEGAISEVAVFKGKMPIVDLINMESFLMKKHGIHPAIAASEPVSSWQEDEWNRQAHALIQQSPPYNDLESRRVPLGALTNHRSVAWQRTNDVTGATVRVSRIGSKFSTGSSDW